MFKKNLSNNWLASSDEKTDKKNKRKSLIWLVIKMLIRVGYLIYKLLEFFSREQS